jgi:hypothetical protein
MQKSMDLFFVKRNLRWFECGIRLRAKRSRVKKNIREYWWKAMVQMNENIVGLDASILMHPTGLESTDT